jgi:hypothetical protein
VTDRYPLPIPFILTDPMTVHWDDQEVTLIHPHVEGDSMLVGLVERLGPHSNLQVVHPDTVEVRIPASALYSTHRRFNPVRTALAAALFVPIGVVGIWAMAWAFAGG